MSIIKEHMKPVADEYLPSHIKEEVASAKEVAFSRCKSEEAPLRAENAIENAIKPYFEEAETIASDIRSEAYSQFIEKMQTYFGCAKIGFVVCPDGRIIALASGDPRMLSVYRELRGMLRTRPSTRADNPTLLDKTLNAAILSAMEENKSEEESPFLVEFIGPHIDSSHPTHGCGAAKGKLALTGRPLTKSTMRDGGLSTFFQETERNRTYEAFDSIARQVEGNVSVIDITHDSHTQGLIAGLRDHYQELRPEDPLRENLFRLAEEGKIVMTERLAEQYKDAITTMAHNIDPTYDTSHPKDMSDYRQLISNTMLIGNIAFELTQQNEKEGFSILTEEMRSAYPEKALRVLTYHLFRNAAYQIVGGIKPGEHWLVDHPEQVLRAGPIGADFNVHTIPFINGTGEEMTNEDIQETFTLYQLMEQFLPKLGVDLDKQARVVMFTGKFNPDAYRDETEANRQYNEIKSTVLENAAKFRQIVKDAEGDGYVVILPIIHDEKTRALTVINTEK